MTRFDCMTILAAKLKDELVVLALSVRRPGTDEADDSDQKADGLTRFSVSEIEVRDSNVSTQNSATIRVGHLRLRVALKRDTADACRRPFRKGLRRREGANGLRHAARLDGAHAAGTSWGSLHGPSQGAIH